MQAEDFIVGMITSSATAGLVFFLSGKLMQRRPPRYPNYWYGYRTQSSLRTRESFNAANRYSAALLVKYGIGLVVFGAVTGTFFNDDYWWIFLATGIAAVIGCAVALVVKTEKFLTAHFDKNGRFIS